jgi:hypothetical protein
MSTALRGNLIVVLLTGLLTVLPAKAQVATLPDPTSSDYCVAVQSILADTSVKATNTVFDNMPDYRASKPSPNPLMIYQVVTYDEVGPIVVSCKVKTVDHLLAEYGENAAGEQKYCPEITRRTQAQAVAELEQTDPEAAKVAAAFIIDENEPYMMGSQYLADFEISYAGEDGAIHFNSPGLQTNWEDWIGIIMPDRLMGQTYCHLATVEYMKRLARGEIEPGTVISTEDGSPTTPR